MEKSQLRQLALDHAQGDVPFDDYVRERTELIDAIAGGRLSIERMASAPPRRRAPGGRDEESIRLDPPERASWTALYIGIGAVVLAGLAWLLLAGDDKPEAPPIVISTQPATEPEPRARSLVTQFVADNNWSASSTGAFLSAWQSLDAKDRARARAAPWFRDFAAGLRQEINARRALAGLAGGDADRIEGRRLVEFARALEMAGQFPDFADPDESSQQAEPLPPLLPSSTDPPPASTAAPETTAPTAPADTASTNLATPPLPSLPAAKPLTSSTSATVPVASSAAGVVDLPDAGPAPPDLAPSGPADADRTDSGSANTGRGSVEETNAETHSRPSGRWFGSLTESHYLLQLFVVTRLDEVRRLVAEHPRTDLHLLQVDEAGEQQAYRVVHGPFADVAGARRAFEQLPEALRRDQSFALVKTVGELRALGARPVPGDDTFTLQLFVFGQRENADKVLGRFPALDLRVYEDSPTDGPFRVLLGRYETAELARNAVVQLPAALREEVGDTPVVKRAGFPSGAGVSR